MSSGWNSEDHILPGLLPLAVPITDVHPMKGNPQVGDVRAIAESLKTLGQHRPLVATADGTILIGNHTYRAALQLGWESIAVLFTNDDREKAVVRALTDNRTSELSHTDPELLHDMIDNVVNVAPELFEMLGWDEFELAVIEERSMQPHVTPGYIPPVLISQPGGQPIDELERSVNSEGTQVYKAPESMDHRAAVVSGAPSTGHAGAVATMTYTLVFDDPEQHRRWFDFIRYLRADPAFEGTIAERLIDFVENHADF